MGEQDLEDALPNPLFAPALIATGHRRPRPEALGQFAPRRAGASHPEHAFHHQTMIDGRTARLRLLRRQEGTQLLTHLSPRERRVIQTRYQLGHEATAGIEDIPLSYTEVSRQLDMTTGLVKAVETRALIKLRFWAERKPYVPGG